MTEEAALAVIGAYFVALSSMVLLDLWRGYPGLWPEDCFIAAPVAVTMQIMGWPLVLGVLPA